MRRASDGFSSRYWEMPSATAAATCGVTKAFPSLPFVWPSNSGLGSLTLITAVRPSRTSSPERLLSESFRTPLFRANSFSERVRAVRKPVRWVPPSIVLMLFANA
jgi:hypothetical protein